MTEVVEQFDDVAEGETLAYHAVPEDRLQSVLSHGLLARLVDTDRRDGPVRLITLVADYYDYEENPLEEPVVYLYGTPDFVQSLMSPGARWAGVVVDLASFTENSDAFIADSRAMTDMLRIFNGEDEEGVQEMLDAVERFTYGREDDDEAEYLVRLALKYLDSVYRVTVSEALRISRGDPLTEIIAPFDIPPEAVRQAIASGESVSAD